jgi:serine/threonine-protein kinase HipA
MKNKCLYCYEDLSEEKDFHEKCAMTFFGNKIAPQIPYSLNQMSDLAKNIVERSISVPGVQPKLSMSVEKGSKKNTNTRLTLVGALGGQYIFKPPSDQFPEMPANEHLTMRIAQAFGINVVPSSLIKLASGELSYITKRIDRTMKGEKIHMLDMFQITEAFDKYKSSMEKVGKAINDYSDNPLLDKIFFFELSIFCFLTGNSDMHLKNFSMIESPSGWILAPAYDLLNVAILFPEDKEELALTLEGKRKKLKWSNFESLGTKLALTNKQIQGVYKRMTKNKTKAIEWINKSFLSEPMKASYRNILEERYEQVKMGK